MNATRILLFLLLTAGIGCTQAQDNPAPAPAPAPTEMQKWIATTDAQWQAAFKRDVTDTHEAELNKLKLQYLTSLETAMGKASTAGDLDGTVALRNEQKRFGDTNVFPAQDEAGDAASVKQIRAAIRVQLAQVEKDAAVRTKALHAKYDAVLAQAQTQLTQRQRIDDALLVKAKRDEVAAAWVTPAVAAVLEKAAQDAPPAVAALTRTGQPRRESVIAAPVSISELAGRKLAGNQAIKSRANFHAPAEVEFEVTTDSELRLGFACDQMIFNWERNRTELRIDGGPANGQHKKGQGGIPTKKSVTVKLTVLRDQMTVMVDGVERARWQADFSSVNQPVSIEAHGSPVHVRHVTVRQVP